MKRLVLILLTLSALVLSFGTLHAQDNSKTCTNDPNDNSGLPQCGTPADNECNPGGTMAGKCDTQWAWDGGWYLARFNRGLLSAAQVPAAYASLLPPPPDSPAGTTGKKGSGGGPTCTVTRSVGTGAYTENVNWLTPYAGQTDLAVGFTGSGPTTYDNNSITPTATSFVYSGSFNGGTSYSGALVIIYNGGTTYLTILCTYTETP